jgi:hypothetical protein
VLVHEGGSGEFADGPGAGGGPVCGHGVCSFLCVVYLTPGPLVRHRALTDIGAGSQDKAGNEV